MNVVWSRPDDTPSRIFAKVYRERLRAEGRAGSEANPEKQLISSRPNRTWAGRGVLGTRELVVPDTPYIIPYRVRRERLELIAVFTAVENGRLSYRAAPLLSSLQNCLFELSLSAPETLFGVPEGHLSSEPAVDTQRSAPLRILAPRQIWVARSRRHQPARNPKHLAGFELSRAHRRC
jgi:toxin ParE1/3/4